MIPEADNKMVSKKKSKVTKVKKKDAEALGIGDGSQIIQCPSCKRMVEARKIKTCSNCAKQYCDRCGGHPSVYVCECTKGSK